MYEMCFTQNLCDRKTNKTNGLVNVFRKICAVFCEMNVILFNVCNGFAMIQNQAGRRKLHDFINNFLAFASRKKKKIARRVERALCAAGCSGDAFGVMTSYKQSKPPTPYASACGGALKWISA